MGRWLLIALVVLLAIWFLHDGWSHLRVVIRSVFWWMFP
jgi:hypothetical protein